MKKYFAGLLTGALVFTLALSALAITGRMTIDVDPINIQVNGETFVPKDVNGKEVPVFAYEGTTYAPLRALAEAYGLEVGYDAAANMATVTDPEAKPEQPATPDTANVPDYSDWSAEDEAAYQEFKGMWEVSTYTSNVTNETVVNLHCYKTETSVDQFLVNHDVNVIEKLCLRFDSELYGEYSLPKVCYFFPLRSSWGWMDMLTSSGWTCGYADILPD